MPCTPFAVMHSADCAASSCRRLLAAALAAAFDVSRRSLANARAGAAAASASDAGDFGASPPRSGHCAGRGPAAAAVVTGGRVASYVRTVQGCPQVAEAAAAAAAWLVDAAKACAADERVPGSAAAVAASG